MLIFVNFVYRQLVALFEMRSLSVMLLKTYTCIFSTARVFFSFFRNKHDSRDVTAVRQFLLSFEVSPQ